ncbi:MAG: DUF3618 domain-containing protein [Actinomycetota bacterium]|nr:DUF3618 domain-containing protein [Actinomycetota bacterium]
MGQDPEAIRQDIERQRDEMSETIDAIGYKADVSSRTKEAMTDRVDAVKDKVGMAKGKVSEKTMSTGDVKGGAQQVVGVAKDNPLGLAAIGSVVVGLLVGNKAGAGLALVGAGAGLAALKQQRAKRTSTVQAHVVPTMANEVTPPVAPPAVPEQP